MEITTIRILKIQKPKIGSIGSVEPVRSVTQGSQLFIPWILGVTVKMKRFDLTLFHRLSRNGNPAYF